MRKYILILCLMFIPVLNAKTYYDYEQIEVEELPTASKDTLDKVYVVNDKYYITSYTKGETTSILNTNLSGKTIYFNFPETDEFKSYFETSQWVNYYVYDTTSTSYIVIRKVTNSNNVICVYSNELGYCYSIYKYDNGLINDSFTFGTDTDIIFDNLYDSKLDFLSEYISLTPFNDTYDWVEVSKYDVNEINVDVRDFYLFYDYEDISNFNILSSYNMNEFTDFQKLVIVIGFNILYLLLVGFVVYLFIKLIYKGISLIFKF